MEIITFFLDSVSISFSYSSSWEVTEYTLKDRNRLLRPLVQRMEVHWLSIMNSVGLVLLLTGFLSIVINRIVKKDITRYSQSLEDGEEGMKHFTFYKIIF